jgi:hypothetical protein
VVRELTGRRGELYYEVTETGFRAAAVPLRAEPSLVIPILRDNGLDG